MQAAIPYIRIGIPALLLVCIFIGTFGSQFKCFIEGKPYLWIYLYMETAPFDDPLYFAKTGWEPFGCPQPFHILNAAMAMGVIGCASSLAGLVSAVLMFKAPSNAPLVLASRVSCLLATLSIVLSMILVIVLYKGKFCGDTFYFTDYWSLDYGFIFLVISAIYASAWSILEATLAIVRGRGVFGSALDETTPLN